MTLLSGSPDKLSVGYISSYPNSSGCGLEVTVRKAGQGKCAYFSAIGKAGSTDHLGPASRGRVPGQTPFYLDLNQHMGSSYLCVYVCHRFPGGPRPASGHHGSAAVSPAMTFSCSLAQDPCSPVPGNGRRLQTYLGKQSRKRGMQIYPQRPCLSNKSKSWFPRSIRAWLRGMLEEREAVRGGPTFRMRGPGRGNQRTNLRSRYRRNEELTLASPVPKGGHHQLCAGPGVYT